MDQDLPPAVMCSPAKNTTECTEGKDAPLAKCGRSRRRRPKIHLLGLVEWAVVIVGVLTFIGFFGRLGWLLELTCHFRVQYFLFLACGTVLFVLAKRRRTAAATAIVALINLLPILPLYLDQPVGGQVGRETRALLWNLNTSNRSPGQVIEFLRQAAPDLMVLLEVDRRWLDTLNKSLGDYPYRCSRPRIDNFGLALYSRFPIESGGIETIGEADVPSVMVRVSVDGESLTIIGTHPPPPKDPVYGAYRDRQLEAIADLVIHEEDPVIVLGDLNATPWSPVFKKLLGETRLVDARRGFGLRPTWPSTFPPLWIPIDHCLVSPGIEIRDFRVGPACGSDHHALVVDMALPLAPENDAP